MKKRNLLLDYIRAISCILVVLYHYTYRYEEIFQKAPSWAFRLPWGWMAVSVFFMLSGYLAISNKKENPTILQYIKEKCIRLFPAYWISVTITFVVTQLFLREKAVSCFDFLINLTMLESFFGVSLVDGAYWTLANELVFYAIFAFVVIILKQQRKYQWFMLAWISVLMIYHFIEKDGLIFAAIGKLIARPYGHMFVVGSSMHFLIKKEERTVSRILSGITIVLSILYQYVTFELNYFVFFIASCVLLGICIFMGNYNYSIAHKEVPLLRPLQTIAAISYPLYLVHQLVGYAIMNGLISNGFQTEFIIIVPICLMMCLAYCIHRFIEIPVSRHFINSTMRIKTR